MELELDELDLTSAESKATYAEIKDYVSFTMRPGGLQDYWDVWNELN